MNKRTVSERDGHHQMLMLCERSGLFASGGNGQAGAIVELLQALLSLSLFPGCGAGSCCARGRQGAVAIDRRRRRGSGCGAPAGRGGHHQVLELVGAYIGDVGRRCMGWFVGQGSARKPHAERIQLCWRAPNG